MGPNSSNASAASITALFDEAHDDGTIGTASQNILTGLNLGDQVALGMGINPDAVNATEITLVTSLVDSSVSMSSMAAEARKGNNEIKGALAGSKQADGVLMATWTFASAPINGYLPLDDVPDLTSANYEPDLGNTPLNDATLVVLAGVVAKTQEFSANGQPVRSVTAIVSDGGDNASRHSANDVATVVHDLERQENHIVFFIGIDDGWTDFRAVAKSMGIADERILVVSNSPSEFRRAMRLVSQSALAVSQAAPGSISQVGFGAFGADDDDDASITV